MVEATHFLCRNSDFRRHQDEGFTEITAHLAAQNMEVIGIGVVQFATCMLSSAHICRKRSSRAEECSGPWPS